MSDFKGKVVLITGASAGIGEATAKLFASRGASLALTGRVQKNLEKVAEECKSLGSEEVLIILAEFSSLEDVKKALDATTEKFSKLDVLVNNVGTTRMGDLAGLAMEDFDYLFNINLKSTVYLTQLAMPHLTKSKGNIVNVSSVASSRYFPPNLLYGMTKAAMDQFTRGIALEYAPKGVRVNSVNPAQVRTKIHRSWGATEEEAEKAYDMIKQMNPMGRSGESDDIANAILHFASDASSWTTGQCLVIDGGMSLTTNASV